MVSTNNVQIWSLESHWGFENINKIATRSRDNESFTISTFSHLSKIINDNNQHMPPGPLWLAAWLQQCFILLMSRKLQLKGALGSCEESYSQKKVFLSFLHLETNRALEANESILMMKSDCKQSMEFLFFRERLPKKVFK